MVKSNFSPIPNALVTQTVTNSAAGISAGSIPAGARYAEGYVRTASIVETRDGTTPTTTKGNQWDAGEIIYLRSRAEITGFQAIEQDTGSTATIDWQFFNISPE